MTNETVKKPWLSPDVIDQIFYFIVLLGILPAVKHLSLFAMMGFPLVHSKQYLSENSKTLLQFLYLIPIGLLLVSLFICGFKREFSRLLGLLPPLSSLFFLAVIVTRMQPESEAMKWIPMTHYLVYQIAFIYFIIKGQLRSAPFFLILLIILLFLGAAEFVLFLIFSILYRLLWKALQQNLAIFKRTGFLGTMKLVFRTCLYWWPLLIFIIPSIIWSNKVYKASLDAIYTNTFVTTTDSTRRYELDQFEADLKIAMNEVTKDQQERINVAGKNFEKLVKGEKDKIAPGFAKELDKATPKNLPTVSEKFKLEDCGFLNVKCGVKNMVKDGMNSSYIESRQDAIDDFEREIQEKVDNSADNVGTINRNAVSFLYHKMKATNEAMQSTISNTFKGVLILNMIMDILLGLLILKSFLYVFARVAFTDDTDHYVSFMDKEWSMPDGQLKKCGNKYTIDGDSSTNYFISRSYEPSGQAPRYVVPQKKAAVLARLFTRNYAMNHIIMEGRNQTVDFRAIGSNEFVEWDLSEGEEVIFHFSNFVGMTQNVQLSATISLRLTSLLMGRFIFTTAQGPGKLILLTQGEPVISGDPKAESSVATSRILAWHKNTRFHVESELNILDVFMSGIYLKKKKEDMVLIDADTKGKAKTGIVQFIKHFLLPI